MKKLLLLVLMTLFTATGITCTETADTLTGKAVQAYKAKNYQKAATLCKRALAKEPNNLMAHVLQGWLYEGEGKIDEAMLEYTKALTVNPKEKDVYIYLGNAYFVKGMLNEALSQFEIALTLDPECPVAHYHIGLTHKSKGNNTLAGKYFYEAGILALLRDEKGIIVKAYRDLKETGPDELEQDFREIIEPWLEAESKKDEAQGLQKSFQDN